jgi:hypothetical protein
MLRSLLAAFAGYIAMSVMVMATFMVVFFAPEFAFRPRTAEASTGWIIYTLIASFFAAIVGGWVAAKLGKSQARRAVFLLAAFVCITGLGSAAANAGREPQGELPPEVLANTMERASHAVQPQAYSWTVPFLGAAGVLLGGHLASRKKPVSEPVA